MSEETLQRLALAKKLKDEDLTDDSTQTIEALGWRGRNIPAIYDAVATVMCALQGNWGLTSDEIQMRDCKPEVITPTARE